MDEESQVMLVCIILRDDVFPLFMDDVYAEEARMMLEYAKPDSPPSWLHFIRVAAMDNACQQWGFDKGWYSAREFALVEPLNRLVN